MTSKRLKICAGVYRPLLLYYKISANIAFRSSLENLASLQYNAASAWSVDLLRYRLKFFCFLFAKMLEFLVYILAVLITEVSTIECINWLIRCLISGERRMIHTNLSCWNREWTSTQRSCTLPCPETNVITKISDNFNLQWYITVSISVNFYLVTIHTRFRSILCKKNAGYLGMII